MQLGVQPKYVEDVVALALSKLTDDSDLKTIIGELKIKYPVWFEESEEDEKDDKKKDKKVGQKGTGSSIKDADKKKRRQRRGRPWRTTGCPKKGFCAQI